MKYTIIERSPDAFQQSVTRENIIAMCQRAFGDKVQIDSVKEIGGGLYNSTYFIRIKGVQPVILRVGPHLARQFHSESYLMRNEYASQPFLAPIAPLLPKILMVDFTHQILERDYLFQTFMQGEQWSQIMSAFTAEEKRVLWRQVGNITSRIHAVQGSSFANSIPGTQFPFWSLAVIDLLKTIIDDLENVHLDATDVRSVLDFAQAHRIFFDEVTQPRLLHGDLWTVNILVQRSEGRLQISAVLDSDRTSWGDPMADWTMFLLKRNAGTEVDAFWETYGQQEQSIATQFRQLIYEGRYLGGIRLEQYRLHHHKAIKYSYQDMQLVIEALKKLCLTL